MFQSQIVRRPPIPIGELQVFSQWGVGIARGKIVALRANVKGRIQGSGGRDQREK